MQRKEEEVFVPGYIKYMPLFYYLVPTAIRDRLNYWQSKTKSVLSHSKHGRRVQDAL